LNRAVAGSPLANAQNNSSQEQIITTVRQKVSKKKKTKVTKKGSTAIDAEYDNDVNYQIRLNKSSTKKPQYKRAGNSYYYQNESQREAGGDRMAQQLNSRHNVKNQTQS